MEVISRSQDRLSPEYSEMLFKRHLQAALVRSGASLIMGLLAIIAFYTASIKSHHLAGVGFSILFLILINPPALWILKRIKSRVVYRYFSLLINLLEIIAYTGIIYSLGGIEATYLTPIYAALITYVGTVSPRSFPFIVAALCALAFSSMVTLEYLGYLPHQSVVSDFRPPLGTQMIYVSVVMGLLFVTAYISAYTAATLKRTRNKLHGKNIELQASVRTMSREITERKQAEEALLQSEEKYRTVLESNPDPVVVYDMEGRVIYLNPAFTRVFGWSLEEQIGKKIDNFVPEENWPETRMMINRVTALGESFSGLETCRYTKEGNILDISISGSCYRDQEGNVAASIINLRDITEQKRLEDQLQKSRKMEAMGLMAGGVAHDLNNILSGIVSYPELLLMNLPEDSPLRKPIKTIQESGMRAADVVEDLMTIARGVASSKEVLKLNTVVEEYLKSAEHQKLERTHSFVNFKTESDPDLLNMSGSPTHIKKTLMNLVTNASEAIEGSGTVTISTVNQYLDEPLKGYEDVRTGEYVMLRVSDDGSGIFPGDLERIFEPFYTKKVMGRSGTGLGLAVVWNMVQDHKGYINVENSEKGTVFELYFPVTREEVAAEREKVPLEDYLGHGEKILVVDDEERQREIASGMLTELGYNAESVSSGEDAIEYVKEHPVDLIVLDMVMPKGINGRETYEQIIKIRPDQKAIIASGYAKTKEVDTAQELGAGKYIKKPYILEKIGLAVKEELEK